jgi:cytochrome P450
MVEFVYESSARLHAFAHPCPKPHFIAKAIYYSGKALTPTVPVPTHPSTARFLTEYRVHRSLTTLHPPDLSSFTMPLRTVPELVIEYKWSLLAFVIIIQIATKCIYHRFFHPLAKIPGPFLPAVTKLYQSYHNCRYYLEIERLHQQYGPIVRITPEEVHIATGADNYDKIYHVGSKFSKSPNFYDALCVPHSSVGTASNEVHRVKRAAMSPIFARQRVLDVEAIVQGKVAKVISRLENDRASESQEGVDLHHAFRAVSVDVISEFAFGTCYDFLDKDDIGADFFEMARGIGPALYVFQQFPALLSVALRIPGWLAPLMSKPLGYVTSMQAECVRQIESVKEKMREGSDPGRPTIFTTLLSEEEKPEGFRGTSTEEVKDEAYSVLVAAADTTGNAMTVAAFNVVHDPVIYEKLARELGTHFPDQTSQLSFVELERLPYLVSDKSHLHLQSIR